MIAGLSVWALTVPTSLGYASLSGVPVENGLYAAAAGLIKVHAVPPHLLAAMALVLVGIVVVMRGARRP